MGLTPRVMFRNRSESGLSESEAESEDKLSNLHGQKGHEHIPL